NVFGIRHGVTHGGAGGDRLLLVTRLMAIVITLLGVFLGLRVPQTGVLLLLGFDLGFAGLVVPLLGGLFWVQATRQGALACIIAGSVTRLVFFALMPTMFGIENTLFYIPNDLFTLDFDGFPTLISPLVGLIAFVIGSKLTYNPLTAEQERAQLREEVSAL
ncbi:MAG: sodium:solute symporter, partial [Cyanobacteria bacterium P01_A01_bin.70]